MNNENFYEEIRAALVERLGCSVKLTEVEKGNGVVRKGFCVENGKVCPILYPSKLTSVEDVVNELVKVYNERPEFEFNGDSVKFENIYLKVFSKELCKYDDCAQFPFLDLVFIPYLFVGNREGEIASARVTRTMENSYSFNLSSRFTELVENTLRLFPTVVKPLTEVLSEFVEVPQEQEAFPIFVITNKFCVNGAASALLGDNLKQLANRVRGDLIVIPSSIHEVLCVSAKDADLNEVNQMIREINQSCIAPEEVLSGHAYYYSLEKEKLRGWSIE